MILIQYNYQFGLCQNVTWIRTKNSILHFPIRSINRADRFSSSMSFLRTKSKVLHASKSNDWLK